MFRPEGLVVAGVVAMVIAACDERPTVVRAHCVVATVEQQAAGAALSPADVTPLLRDAADRLAPALGSESEGAVEIRRRLSHLASVWPAGDANSRCEAVNSALRALQQFPDDQATAADRAAVRITIDLAAASIAVARD